jgi:lysophospholipase L1-like esterase
MFSKSKVVALEILPASKAYEKKVPGISSEIKRQIITTINNDDFNQNGLLPDLFHLNKDGHHLIFKKISILLEEFQ